jgi:mannose-6-phosphate isomerase-like protein (cupin superfamily)
LDAGTDPGLDANRGAPVCSLETEIEAKKLPKSISFQNDDGSNAIRIETRIQTAVQGTIRLAMPAEFDLIRRYFTHATPRTALGVGDDAALITVGKGQLLAVAADMLVAGRNFFKDADPESVGHKALAVNLSDMAAMGATPRWATMGIALPQADARWVAAFSRGFMELARKHGVDLIGGDTTRGPLNICVQIIGEGGENNLHSHKGLDGFWMVLSGQVKFYGPGDVLIGEFGKHEGILIPADAQYWFESSSDEPLEILQMAGFDKSVKLERVDVAPQKLDTEAVKIDVITKTV